jgi:hypothetical protein
MRKVCVAIGVSRAEGLAPLRAAATAAEEIGQWAELSGFAKPEDIAVLTDREEAVTIELICSTLERLLPMGVQTDTLLLHFAGHGLREDSTRTLWLPSDWRTKLRAIAVERLKNRLSDYGIANVTIISDACKVLAADHDTSDLTPDGVLGAGITKGSRPIFDRFDAVHDMQAAFMIPGATPKQSRCLFSGAMIEGLWGATAAIDPNHEGKVTPGSLADYITKRVAALTLAYRVSCEPLASAGRPADHLIYFDLDKVDPARIPTLPPWPEPIRVKAGVVRKPLVVDDEGQYEVAHSAPRKGRPRVASGSSDRGRSDDQRYSGTRDGGSFVSVRREIRTINQSDPPYSTEIEGGKVLEKARGPSPVRRAPKGLRWPRPKTDDDRAGWDAIGSQGGRRPKTGATFRAELPEDGSINVAFAGAKPKAIWARRPVQRITSDTWLTQASEKSEQLMVEYADDIFFPIVVYPRLLTAVARDSRGTLGWLFHGFGQTPDASRPTIDLLGQMQVGTLQPSVVDEVAADLRFGKHGNPVLGALCAYLYDYVGDLDSIRRMASFYWSAHQPVPYDIALLGELAVIKNGRRYAGNVEEVGERPSFDRQSRLPDFVTDATPAREGAIGGLCPWFRQGWDFVDAPTEPGASLVHGLPDVRRHLRPETFTSFDRAGGMILTSHWKMERYK